MKEQSIRLGGLMVALVVAMPLMSSAQPPMPPGPGFGPPGMGFGPPGPMGPPGMMPPPPGMMPPPPGMMPPPPGMMPPPPPPLPPPIVGPPMPLPPPPIPIPPPMIGGRVSVVTTSLNVRTGPGTGYPVMTAVGYGTVLNVLSSSAGWLQVALAGGYTGWVAGNYVVPVP